MKAYGYAVMIAALTLVSCDDQKADRDPLAPEAAAVGAATPQFNASVNNGSSVCLASHKDLAEATAELEKAPDSVELLETRDALAAIAADVCS